jgi:hypothetical protein
MSIGCSLSTVAILRLNHKHEVEQKKMLCPPDVERMRACLPSKIEATFRRIVNIIAKKQLKYICNLK